MKKIKAILELSGFVVVGTTIEKIALPTIKKTMEITPKKTQSNYRYTQKNTEKAAPLIIKKSNYSYGKKPKKIPLIPKKINVDLNLKFWLEWKLWNQKLGTEKATGEWLDKYIVGQYYLSTKFLTANDYWNYFEKKLLRLKFGNDEFKKREFYDIIRDYRILFKGEN